MEKEVISTNLRRLRSAKSLSQAQVAEDAAISRIAYRKIESGESLPKVSTLQSLAQALGVKLQDLVTPVPTLKAVRFRALKKVPGREQILVDVARWLEDFNFLEEILDDRTEYRLRDLAENLSREPRGPERAEKAAAEARMAFGLSEDEPIRDICGLLESKGVKVFPMARSSDAFFGLSVGAHDGGPAVIVNVWSRISVERWIFSAAHELGHLLLHLDAYDVARTEEDESQETEANLFASYFLAPRSVFRREWDDAYGLPFIDRVLKVKRIFRMSYRTVLYRLSMESTLGDTVWSRFVVQYRHRTGITLGRTDETEALPPSSFQASAPESERSREPDYLSKSDFVEDRLSELVRQAIEKDEISLARGAEILRTDLGTMRDLAASWVG